MASLEQAKNLLLTGEYTCVLCGGEQVHTSVFRGVKPLVQLLRSGVNVSGFYAADKVVGKATAFLYILLGVQAVYAKVISRSAREVLQEHGIAVQYDVLSESIINRKGDGICPFEAAVMDVSDPEMAYPVILRKMEEMNIPLD